MSTEAEIQARCLAEKLGGSACAELMTPVCDGRGVVIEFGKPVRCVDGEGSARKSAILLAEAEARRVSSRTPWLVLGGVVLLGVVVYAATR